MKLLDPRGVSIEVSDEYGAELLASARGYRERQSKKTDAPAPAAPRKPRAKKSEEETPED